MINGFDKKINNFPQDIQDVLLCDFGRFLEKDILRKYNLPNNKFIYLGEIVSSIYFGDLDLKDVVKRIMDVFMVDEVSAKKIALDLIGMRVLVAGDYLKDQNIEGFVKSLGGDINEYKKYIEETKKEIKKEKSGAEDEPIVKILKSDYKERKIDIGKEREDSLDIFKNNLVELLKYSTNPYLIDYNLILFQIIAEDFNFKKELENALYSNQEKITENVFNLDNQKSAPTVANWLKDFIKKAGSGMFDNVALTKYLTQSENGKKLNPEERKLVGDLLELYRNLKFFPDSMPSDDGEGWEILPIEKDTQTMTKARTVLGPPKTEKEKIIDELRGMSAQYLPGSLEKKVIDEEIRRMGKMAE